MINFEVGNEICLTEDIEHFRKDSIGKIIKKIKKNFNETYGINFSGGTNIELIVENNEIKHLFSNEFISSNVQENSLQEIGLYELF